MKRTKTAKRLLAILLALISSLTLVTVPALAAEFSDVISVEIKSDIAGLTEADFEKMLIVKSGNIRFDDLTPFSTINLSDYSGNPYFDKLKPGRTYNIWFTLRAEDGYTLPEVLNAQNTQISCGKNVNVYWYGITTGTDSEGEPCHFVAFWTEITVDGNPLQMFFGRILDVFLKIKSWSPY
mgnify:CR=1 FL=1